MKKILYLLLATVLAFSCGKDPEVPKDIVVTSITISASVGEVTTASAVITGTCSALSKMSSVKAYYGTANPPSTPVTVEISGTSFTASVSGLTLNTTYYFFAEATGGGDTFKSEVGSFKTLAFSVPTVTTKEISDVTSVSAKSGGNITYDGEKEITGFGVVWSTSQNPTIDLPTRTTDGAGRTGEFSSSITGLTANTTYYVRAYATNSEGTAYGEEKTFTTSKESATGDNEDVDTDDKHNW